MRVLLLLLVAALAGCAASDEPVAQMPEPAVPSTLQGIVIDGNIVPLVGATVTLDGERNTTTDSVGQFFFQDVEPGNHRLAVSMAGYVSQEITVLADGMGEVTVQLAPEVVDVPRAVGVTYTGFVACEAIVLFFLEECDRGTGVFGQPDNRIFLRVEDTQPDAVQVEVIWDATQSVGESMTATWGSCQGEFCTPYGETGMCQHWGTSPLWCRVGATGGEANGRHMYSQGIKTVGHGLGVDTGIALHLAADCSICGDPVAPEYGVGLVFDQAIETYAWSFYNMEPAAGWVFATDGEPVV